VIQGNHGSVANDLIKTSVLLLLVAEFVDSEFAEGVGKSFKYVEISEDVLFKYKIAQPKDQTDHV
jgi:hypothetical protein